MGRFTPHYTPEQKDGVAEDVVDRGYFPKQTVERARAGEIPDLEPFEILLSTVQKQATKLRRERQGRAIKLKRARGTPEKRLLAATVQTLAIVEHALDRMQRKEEKHGLKGMELKDLKELCLIQRELRARSTPPSSHTGQAKRNEDKRKAEAAKPAASDFVRQLEREHRKSPQANGSSTTPTPTGNPTPLPSPAQQRPNRTGERADASVRATTTVALAGVELEHGRDQG